MVRHFPGLRFVEDWPNLFEDVFQCPEGARVRMPGICGCGGGLESRASRGSGIMLAQRQRESSGSARPACLGISLPK
jgi:hypothetical protein